jgi:hypothetical protein
LPISHVTPISSTITVLNPLHLLPAPSLFRQEFHRGVYQGKQGKRWYVEIDIERSEARYF